MECDFPNIKGSNTTGEAPSIFGEIFTLAANPGEYEFKLLWNNKLARSIKFTVQPGGKFDRSITGALKKSNRGGRRDGNERGAYRLSRLHGQAIDKQGDRKDGPAAAGQPEGQPHERSQDQA